MIARLVTLFFVFSMPFAHSVFAQREYPEISSRINKKSATVGESIEYTVDISGSDISGFEISLPEKKNYFFPDQHLKHDDDPRKIVPLYSVTKADIDRGGTGDEKKISAIIEIIFYVPGKHRLPELAITDFRKESAGYKIPEIEIVGLNKEGKLEDIEGPLDAERSYFRTVVALIAALLLMSLIFAAIRRFIRKKRKPEGPKPARPPLEIFLDSLEKIDALNLAKNRETVAYSAGVSMLFRKFISALYDINAADMTVSEIEISLGKAMRFTQKDKYLPDIMSSFRLWEISKFASFSPAAETLELDLERIKKTASRICHDGVNSGV